MRHDREGVALLAESLFCLAKAGGALQAVRDGVRVAVEKLDQTAPVKAFLADPAVSAEGKKQTISDLLSEGTHPILRGFLAILVDEGCLCDLADIASAFFELCASSRQRISGELVSAVDVPPELVTAIEAETAAAIGHPVELHVRVSPRILGGYMVRAGDLVLDATVDRHIEDIRRHLLG